MLQFNQLSKENSPYLLQHAQNPVHWQPWSDEIMESALEEKKLVLISIGYSACHWCHVMEKECFEDEEVAELMNKHFISIKIDREEHPDVDQVYMTALQLMMGSGGWPLNVICLPDGRPIWGATYAPKDKWMQSLEIIQDLYISDPEKVYTYASQLHEGIQKSELIPAQKTEDLLSREEFDKAISNWTQTFDSIEGGPNRAPKFPMPVNLDFFMKYAEVKRNREEDDLGTLKHAFLTLDKMALGGIYDQVGGGFSRYSVDELWKAPHFEKMLYDNAQLISSYSTAYRISGKSLYQNVAQESILFLEREMKSPEGAFYSALDADSEGEEGKFYVWSKVELEGIIPATDWSEFEDYYDLKKGEWESHIILLRSGVENEKAREWNKLLINKRTKRIRPDLDNKILCSWNALMVLAYADFWLSNGLDENLEKAINLNSWLWENLKADQVLMHVYSDKKIDAVLEDYVLMLSAQLKLFECTSDESYLIKAEHLIKKIDQEFGEKDQILKYSRNLKSSPLIAKSQDVYDNVIPSANSILANNLYKYAAFSSQMEYKERAHTMFQQIQERSESNVQSLGNWMGLGLHFLYQDYELIISGPDAKLLQKDFQKNYYPLVYSLALDSESKLELFANRYDDSNKFYLCQSGSCHLPQHQKSRIIPMVKY